MPDIDRRALIAGASLLGAMAFAKAAKAGQLAPPMGPVAETGRSLRDVEPRTPMSGVAPGSGGLHEITVAGSYFLTGNIDVPPGMDGIVIKCNGPVAIDLRGFSIRGSGGGSGRGVSVSGYLPLCYLEVFDGFIHDLDGDGIDGGLAGHLEVDDVHLADCARGIRKALGRMKCSDITLERMASDGVVFEPSSVVPGAVQTFECVIDDCEFSECNGTGISLGGDWAGLDGSIWVCDCDCHRCGLDGIGGTFSAGGGGGGAGGSLVSLTIADCVCSSNGRFGIGVEAPTSPIGIVVSVTLDLNDCTCARNVQAGVKVNRMAGEICDLECVANGGDGIELLDFTGSMESCFCSHNTGNGLSATNVQGTIEEVECRSNGGDGMHSQALTGNIECCVCSNNGGAGLRLTASVPGCTCVCDCGWSGNAQQGLHADASCTSVSISECEARNNGTGFQIDGPNNLLVWNMASGNSANYVFDPVTCPMVVIAPSALATSTNPHANYAF